MVLDRRTSRCIQGRENCSGRLCADAFARFEVIEKWSPAEQGMGEVLQDQSWMINQ